MKVQVDKSNADFKDRSHSGRSSDNNTDCISIVEFANGIIRAYAKDITNKESSDGLSIIISPVANNSVIWTDEHHSCGRLSELVYYHCKVCHECEFVNYVTRVNTQSVESFHGCLKNTIKKRKWSFS